MKTVSTKLDKRDFEKFQEMCNNDGQCMSESLRELIKLGIDAYEDDLELQIKNNVSKNITSEPETKNVRVSYDDGKTWYDLN